MLKGFSTILMKELKELIRDPKILIGMIVVPLIMFPVLGAVLGYASQTAIEQAQKATLIVVDNDNGNWSQQFISNLGMYINVVAINSTTPQQVLDQNLLSQYNSTSIYRNSSWF